MENIDVYAKKAAKITGTFCAAAGVLALSSVVISGAAVGAAVGLCKCTKDIVSKMWKDKAPAEKNISAEENTNAENESIAEVVAVNGTSEDDPDIEENETIKIDN